MPAQPLTAAKLFELVFAPCYPPDVLADLPRARTSDANPAGNPSLLATIDQAAAVFARLAPDAFGVPDLALDYSDASVHRLGAALTRERRDAWLSTTGDEAGLGAEGAEGRTGAPKGKPKAGEPPMLVTIVTHGALYVGACIVKNHGGRWLVRRPLWESLVRLESRAGTGDLALFQWWLKALGDEEIDRGRLSDRYRIHVEVPTFDAAPLPVIAPSDRRIPKLAKVRYDTLYKHLRAHLPELRSVGDDFPSPERFEEMGWKSMEFALLGGGKMLLMHGATMDGVRLIWLDANGFVKSAFYPADSSPSHWVQIEGEKLRVIVPIGGEVRAHEMLWWGA